MKPTAPDKLLVKSSLLSALFTVLLLMLVNYYFNHNWNFFENSQMKIQTFSVQGTATATGTPDQSDISFTVSKTAAALQDAQNQANASMNIIISDLTKIGVSKNDIQTSNYNSSPNYTDNEVEQPAIIVNPPSQTIQSYTVSEDVDVTIHNTVKIASVIDTVTRDNAEDISGPNLTFSDTKQQQLENQARTTAIYNAKQKAQSLSSAAGIRLGKVINVQENQPTPIYPIHPLMMSAKSVQAVPNVPTQINTGQNSVTATITLTYEIN